MNSLSALGVYLQYIGLHGNNGLDPATCVHLIKVYVLPVLTYGLEIILPKRKYIDKLNSLLKRLLKQVLSLPTLTADPVPYILSGLLPIEGQIHIKALNFFNNICLLPENTVEKRLARRQSAISEISSKATKTLGFLRRNLAFAPRHTKEVAYKTLVRPKLEYAAPIWHPYHETQIGQVEKVQRTAAMWTCRRWRNTSSVGDMLDDLEWPSLETRREQSSLTFFYKIHSGTVDLDKDKYLTPAPNLRRTRASHESQYTRYFAYSDALKNSFSPRTIPMWNSLPSSVVSSKTIEEFKAQI